jgi:hypothetical protein
MEGRYGKGRSGVRYFYYACRNAEYNLKVSANEIETAVLERNKQLACDDMIFHRLTDETNIHLQKQKPLLRSNGKDCRKVWKM